MPAPNPHGHLIAARALLLSPAPSAGAVAKAEALARAAIAAEEAGPQRHAPLNTLADALRRAERWSEATEALRGALQLRPADPASHVNLGAALLKQTRPHEAERCFHAALALAPTLAASDDSAGNAVRGLEAAQAMQSETSGRRHAAHEIHHTKSKSKSRGAA